LRRLAIVSQKEGVGKSTLTRLVAPEYAKARWSCQDCLSWPFLQHDLVTL